VATMADIALTTKRISLGDEARCLRLSIDEELSRLGVTIGEGTRLEHRSHRALRNITVETVHR
jgi:hypothetical protein